MRQLEKYSIIIRNKLKIYRRLAMEWLNYSFPEKNFIFFIKKMLR
ncbi:hypothetical protein MTBBW1_750024 [Desulfamplus magnetovallimortis]|uniref:Uncharacterized protein n=1 Tax=Desulfamplus magnetovallimortis TaxID=1246637 RepID=A0A1W1HJ71_9BACT|nr:hypothetical protein MTBBW1_750024 [Desulfamplus magnetovallimortis]